MNAFDAIYTNNMAALKDYLQNGDVNIKNERGMSLLHYAIVFILYFTTVAILIIQRFSNYCCLAP